MMQTLLIDSGALLAMIDAGDKHYAPAAAFARSHTPTIFYLPETVFIETMVLVKARLGAQPAIDLGARLTEFLDALGALFPFGAMLDEETPVEAVAPRPFAEIRAALEAFAARNTIEATDVALSKTPDFLRFA